MAEEASSGGAWATVKRWLGILPEPAKAERPAYLLAEIGAVATLWSDVESEWYHVFATLVRELTQAQRKAIFSQFKTSNGQRMLVMAVADAMPNIPRNLRGDLGRLNDESGAAAGERNAIIHCEFETEWTGRFFRFFIAPGDISGEPNALAGRDAYLEAKRVKNRVDNLRQRLKTLRLSLENDPLKMPPPRRR